MKIITKNYEVFQFEELEKEIKEKLIEEEKKYQYEFYLENDLYYDIKEAAKNILKRYIKEAEIKNIYYSLSYCQGDGCMIEFEFYYYNNLIKVNHNGFYYHSRCFSVSGDEYLTEKQQNKLYNKILNIQQEIEKKAWSFLNYDPDMGFIIDNLKENKYLKDGSVF